LANGRNWSRTHRRTNISKHNIMAQQKTNLLEIVLRDKMIGKTIYIAGVAVVIEELNYDQVLGQCRIQGDDGNIYKLGIDENFVLEYDEVVILKPNKKKLLGKNNRR